jgi:hypothetical protein
MRWEDRFSDDIEYRMPLSAPERPVYDLADLDQVDALRALPWEDASGT